MRNDSVYRALAALSLDEQKAVMRCAARCQKRMAAIRAEHGIGHKTQFGEKAALEFLAAIGSWIVTNEKKEVTHG